MITVANICERLRQRCEQLEGEPCPDEGLKVLWMALVNLVGGRLEDLVQVVPPNEREETRENFLALQADYQGELDLMEQFLAEWRAKAQERGCGPEEAQQEAMFVLIGDFEVADALPPIDPNRRYRFRDIRERIRQKLQIAGTSEEGALMAVCGALVQLVFDRSGLSLRLMSTKPSYWSLDMEGAFDRLQRRYAEELDLLEQELRRFVKATAQLSDRASYRLVTRRLNREFLDKRRR